MAGYADCVAGFVDALNLDRPHVAGLSFGGALALELGRRHPAIPKTLILASAYAGWGGSLPIDVADQRLQQALRLADLPPDEFVGELLPTMFSKATAACDHRRVRCEHVGVPSGRLPGNGSCVGRGPAPRTAPISVPTLLVYGDEDVRAPLTIAHDLEAAISGSRLVVLPGAGHLCNIEAADEFNRAVREFLRSQQLTARP